MAQTKALAMGPEESHKLIDLFHLTDDNREAIYEPLDAKQKQFRLLHLQAGRASDIISCSIQVASLSDDPPPQYETISYCWGDPEPNVSVNINGSHLKVPTNAALAISRMRLPDRYRTLWIDAVCINQADLDERAQQVLLMKDIYGEGTGNLIYLGEEESWTASALKSIRLVLEDIERETANSEDLVKLLLEPTGAFKRSDIPMGVQVDFASLETFWGLPYFKRVWILQEILLSRSNLCFLGSYEFPLLSILRAVAWFGYKSYYLPPTWNAADAHVVGLWPWLENSRNDTGSKQSHALINLLLLSMDRETMDDRDRVYAVLGLLRDVPSDLLPDYNRPVVEVLTSATRHSFRNGRLANCTMLRLIKHRNEADLESETWPSWVPPPGWLEEGPTVFSRHFYADGNLDNWQSYDDDEDFAFWNTASLKELVLPGFKIGEVDVFSDVLSKESTRAEQLRATLNGISNMVFGKPLEEMSSHDRFVLFAALTGGDNETPEPSSEVDVPEIGHLLIFNEGPSNESSAATRSFMSKLYMCYGRVVFRTKSGHIGLGPKLTKRGDIVVVFYGSRCPAVLRPKDNNTYKFVGLSYVHGRMFGEAEELVDPNADHGFFRMR